MDKGQAHVAIILIVVLALMVTGIVVFVLVTDSSTGGSSWGGTSVPGGSSWTPQPPSSTPLPGVPCSTAGLVYDCDNQCVEQALAMSYIGDYDCDDGINSLSGMNLNCPEFQNDGGDCSGTTPTTPTTPTGDTSWCPIGATNVPAGAGGVYGVGYVEGIATYEGESMCVYKFTSGGMEYTFYQNQAGDHYYLLDSQGTMIANHDFPMGIDSTGDATSAWSWMHEGAFTTISHSVYADFVNAKIVPGDSRLFFP